MTPSSLGRSNSYHLTREVSFYQEAWEAAHDYLRKLGEQLKGCGFRALTDEESEQLSTQPHDETHVLSLISTPNASAETAIHLVQLPLDLSHLLPSLVSDPHGSAQTALYLTHISPSFSPIITSHSMSITPLADLIHFLQCLLPPSAALALCPPQLPSSPPLLLPSSTGHSEMDGVSESKRMSVFDLMIDQHDTPDSAVPHGTAEDQGADRSHRVRFAPVAAEIPTNDSPGHPPRHIDLTSVPALSEGDDTLGLQLRQFEHKGVARRSAMRPPTPAAVWLDKHEALLRDTVGCSYFRQLREVAV